MFEQEVKIPKERVAILVGTKGVMKRFLQRKTKTKLTISREGDVIIAGKENIDVFDAVPIIKAIGRGFNPDIAIMLLDETFAFELISLKDFARNDKDMVRVRSRLIGTNGKARHMLEKLTGLFISVQGKTVCLIGKIDDMAIGMRAMEKLLKGAPHGNVYKFIETEKERVLRE